MQHTDELEWAEYTRLVQDKILTECKFDCFVWLGRPGSHSGASRNVEVGAIGVANECQTLHMWS